jgi:hypothetical protein
VAYTYKHLSQAEVDKIKADAVKKPEPPTVDAATLRAWEADRAAHSALRDAATDPEVKKQHVEALATLDAALAKHSR